MSRILLMDERIINSICSPQGNRNTAVKVIHMRKLTQN